MIFKENRLYFIVLLLIFSMISVAIVDARSWDGERVNKENFKWEGEISRWDKIIADWDAKRNQLHSQYYGDNYDETASGCLDGDCWEESMFDLTGTINGQKYEFDKERCDTELTFANGDHWDCGNGGQGIEFTGANGEYWESGNFGQGLEYKDQYGNKWSSGNIGQGIEFTGANGEHWESDNFGQGVEHTDTSGKTWDGSDDDTIDNMR